MPALPTHGLAQAAKENRGRSLLEHLFGGEQVKSSLHRVTGEAVAQGRAAAVFIVNDDGFPVRSGVKPVDAAPDRHFRRQAEQEFLFRYARPGEGPRTVGLKCFKMAKQFQAYSLLSIRRRDVVAGALLFERTVERAFGDVAVQDGALQQVVETIPRLGRALPQPKRLPHEKLERALQERLDGGGRERRVANAKVEGLRWQFHRRRHRGPGQYAPGSKCLPFLFEEEGAQRRIASVIEARIAEDDFFGGARSGQIEQETLLLLEIFGCRQIRFAPRSVGKQGILA